MGSEEFFANSTTYNYKTLIVAIFGQYRECVQESEFLERLPLILGHQPGKWASEDLAVIVKKVCGLEGKCESYTEVAKHFGVSPTTIARQYAKALRLLRTPIIYSKFVTNLTEEEVFSIRKYNDSAWKRRLSDSARRVIFQIDADNKKEFEDLFSHVPKMSRWGVLYPTNSADDDKRASSNQYMSLKVFNEIRETLGITPVEQQKSKPSASSIARAITILERAGYTVIKQSDEFGVKGHE